MIDLHRYNNVKLFIALAKQSLTKIIVSTPLLLADF